MTDNSNPIMDEEIAEAEYVRFKKFIEQSEPGTRELFWKKVYYYLTWRIPGIISNEVDLYNQFWSDRHKCECCKAKYHNAHADRPGWIRKPPGGDDYDNGKRQERTFIPL